MATFTFLATSTLPTQASSNSRLESKCESTGDKFVNVVKAVKSNQDPIVLLEWNPKDEELAGLDIEQKCKDAETNIQSLIDAGHRNLHYFTGQVADKPTLCIQALEGDCGTLSTQEETRNQVKYVVSLESATNELHSLTQIKSIADVIIPDEQKTSKTVVIKLRGNGAFAMTKYRPISIWERFGF